MWLCVLEHLSESLLRTSNFQYPPMSVRLDSQPLSTLKQKSRNRPVFQNDVRLVFTNTPLKISRLVAQMQAQLAQSSLVPLISICAVCFAQECKYSEYNR